MTKAGFMLEEAENKLKTARENERYAMLKEREAKEQMTKLKKLRSQNV